MPIRFISDRSPHQGGPARHALWRVRSGFALASINAAGIYRIVWCADPADLQSSIECMAAKDAAELLDKLLAGKARLAAYGTPFQCAVWNQVARIPYAGTSSYGEIAHRLATRAARAVGGAVGKNPLYVVIPCHRVIAGDGSLGGYGWGLEHKRALLESEQRGEQWFMSS